MDICNCHKDLDALLCGIPKEWRTGIVNSLCLILENKEPDCKDILKCETVTYLSPFTLNGDVLSISYKNERGQVVIRSIDLTPAFRAILDDLDPVCFANEEDWENMTFEEKLFRIYEEMAGCSNLDGEGEFPCFCVPTSSSTTTTTTAQQECFDYYLADQFDCVDGDCVATGADVLVRGVCDFQNIPGIFYPNTLDHSQLFQITTFTLPDVGFIELDVDLGTMTCNFFCTTTTTTTIP